ncbi:MAG: membrane-bound lytic murein transglycosylase MltF [bacterium]
MCLILILLALSACNRGSLENSSRFTALDKIRKSGAITVITQNDPYCFYIYRGNPMGFEYELAQAFAKFLGVSLKVQTAHTWDGMIGHLGQAHLIAANLGPSVARLGDTDFSDSYLTVQQHLIFHKNRHDLKSIDDLEGKTIHVQKGSSYEDRLRELQREGLHLTIKTYEDVTTEDLIQKVAQKEIEITIANSNIALLNRRYYPDIQIGFSIKKSQSLAWAVLKGEEEFVEEINRFFKTITEDGTFDRIFNRYYENIEHFDYVDIKKFHSRLQTKLPKYKDLIKKASQRHRFDWRLIAAQIYQESHFNPRARSFTGVRGLMMLTIPTAQLMGIDNRLDPDQSIKGGVKYLRRLYNCYDKAEERDRILISLAAYNVGPGHIQDAQEIAQKMNMDPYKWSSLKKTLPLLSRPEYYQSSKYGYCRGYEPVQYVQRIMTYYDILRQKDTEVAYLAQNQSSPTEG